MATLAAVFRFRIRSAMEHLSTTTVEDGEYYSSLELCYLQVGTLTSLFRYAVERTDTFIKIWFWARNNNNIPADIPGENANINTDAWVCVDTTSTSEQFLNFGQGTPFAYFPNTSCSISDKFGAHNIIINCERSIDS